MSVKYIRIAMRLRQISALSYALPIALALGMLSGCAHVPVQEAVQYTDAFDQVAAVTTDLLTDYSAAIDTVVAQEAAPSGQPPVYPVQFNPDTALASEEPDPVVLGFQNALHAIEAYNDTLLGLARGQSTSELQSHPAKIVQLIRSLAVNVAPAAQPAADMIQELLALLTQAKSHKQFNDALLKGRPIVDALLHQFTEATPDFYRVRVGIVGAAITDIEFKQEIVLDELDRIAQAYALPVAGTELALRRAQVESEVAALRIAISPDGLGRPLPAGDTPYDDGVQHRLEEQVRVLRGLCDERRALAAGLTTYHDYLAEYVRLLDDSRRYFDALLHAVEKPDDTQAAVRAHDMSSKAANLRLEMRESRSAAALQSAAKP